MNTTSAPAASTATPTRRSLLPGSRVAIERFARRAGSRLILIISLVPRRAQREPDADEGLGRVRGQIGAVEARIELDALPRIGDLDRQPRAPLDRAVQRG